MPDSVKQPASGPATDATRDQQAIIDDLLVGGLDHYFGGRYERAIQVWTRVFFLDRGHARARAYIDRARSAIAERQRESEELLAGGLSALSAGDPEQARRLLTSSVDRGGAQAEALAALDRLERLGALDAAGSVGEATLDRAADVLAAPRDPKQRVVAQAVLTGAAVILLSVAVYLVATWDRLGRFWEEAPAPVAPSAVITDEPLPLPDHSRLVIARSRRLFGRGQFREALLTVSAVHPLDEHYAEAQALRADIQRALLSSLPQRPETSAHADSRPRQP